MSIRSPCRTVLLNRTVYFYQSDPHRDEPVIKALTEIAAHFPRYGFKNLFQILRRPGITWILKPNRRFYCILKFNCLLTVACPQSGSAGHAGILNQNRSIDFMHDALVCSRRVRTLTWWMILIVRSWR